MSAEEWISGMNTQPPTISLKPESMKSNRDKKSGGGDFKGREGGMTRSAPSASHPLFLDDELSKQQEKRLEQSLKEKLTFDTKLEQDSMEGVDEEEWNE
jgi:hypothetical protein